LTVFAGWSSAGQSDLKSKGRPNRLYLMDIDDLIGIVIALAALSKLIFI